LVDRSLLTFQPLDINTVIVLGSDGNLWLEHAPSGNPPPTRQQIDANVVEFLATDSSNVLVLGSDGKLWWKEAPLEKCHQSGS
jgi:hypothetical protein